MAPDRRPHVSMKRGQDSRSLASLSSVSQPPRSTSSVCCLACRTTRRSHIRSDAVLRLVAGLDLYRRYGSHLDVVRCWEARSRSSHEAAGRAAARARGVPAAVEPIAVVRRRVRRRARDLRAGPRRRARRPLVEGSRVRGRCHLRRQLPPRDPRASAAARARGVRPDAQVSGASGRTQFQFHGAPFELMVHHLMVRYI